MAGKKLIIISQDANPIWVQLSDANLSPITWSKIPLIPAASKVGTIGDYSARRGNHISYQSGSNLNSFPAHQKERPTFSNCAAHLAPDTVLSFIPPKIIVLTSYPSPYTDTQLLLFLNTMSENKNTSSSTSTQDSNNSASATVSVPATTVVAPPTAPTQPSRNQYAKQGWGSRWNFQLSYGLKPCM